MSLYDRYIKWRMRWYRLHSWMAFRSFGSYGGGGRLDPPIQLFHPERIHVGKDFLAHAGCMLACITEYGTEKYNGEIIIGDHVHMREDVQISAAQRITIGSNCGFGRGVIITDNQHGFLPEEGPHYGYTPLMDIREVVIEEGVFFGAYCRIAPGVRIGARCVISAGAVVTKDIPPYSMVAGSRIVKRYNRETKNWE